MGEGGLSGERAFGLNIEEMRGKERGWQSRGTPAPEPQSWNGLAKPPVYSLSPGKGQLASKAGLGCLGAPSQAPARSLHPAGTGHLPLPH